MGLVISLMRSGLQLAAHLEAAPFQNRVVRVTCDNEGAGSSGGLRLGWLTGMLD